MAPAPDPKSTASVKSDSRRGTIPAASAPFEESEMVRRPDHIEIFPRYHGELDIPRLRWYWRLRSSNGRIRAIGGENFVSKSNAKRAAMGCFPKIKSVVEVAQ